MSGEMFVLPQLPTAQDASRVAVRYEREAAKWGATPRGVAARARAIAWRRIEDAIRIAGEDLAVEVLAAPTGANRVEREWWVASLTGRMVAASDPGLATDRQWFAELAGARVSGPASPVSYARDGVILGLALSESEAEAFPPGTRVRVVFEATPDPDWPAGP